MTVIDGATNATTTVAAGHDSRRRGREPGDEQDLRRQRNSDNVTVIDGATNATTTVAAGTQSRMRWR